MQPKARGQRRRAPFSGHEHRVWQIVQKILYSRRVSDVRANLARRRAIGGLSVLLVVMVGVAIDQLVKQWALSDLASGRVIGVLPTFDLRLVFNPGVAFGMGAGLGPIVAIVLIGVLAALAGWVTVKIWRGEMVDAVLLSVVLAGGLGNVIDRVFRAPEEAPLTGEVVDYLAVSWFAIFNLADVFTVGGVVVWLLVVTHRSRRRHPSI